MYITSLELIYNQKFIPFNHLHPILSAWLPASSNHKTHLFIYECICWLVFWSTTEMHHYVSSWYLTQWFYISIHNTVITSDKSSYHLLPYKDICCLVTKSCPTLWSRGLYSLPGSSDHGIFQARMLKWVAIFSSRRSSQPRDQTHVSCIGRRILYCLVTREEQYKDNTHNYSLYSPCCNFIPVTHYLVTEHVYLLISLIYVTNPLTPIQAPNF